MSLLSADGPGTHEGSTRRAELQLSGGMERSAATHQMQRPRTVPKHSSHKPTAAALAEQSTELRELILEVAHRAHVGHIASCLSIVDILTAVFAVLEVDDDTFILSKGHAGLALYAALYQHGCITHDALFSYCRDDSVLAVHPGHRIPGVQFTTGSLGYGLGFAAGVSLARRITRAPGRCVALLSDAELNEGSVWEAIMFAGHRRLPLTAIVDANGRQAMGTTDSVLDLEPLAPKFAAFGWDVHEIDGHDPNALMMELTVAADSRPSAIIARTVSGRGVHFMEGRVEWHYWPLSDSQYAEARREVRPPQP